MAVPLSNIAPNLLVSKLCLGTMTFGEQNSLSQSFRLMDKAFESGINFFDSAEMYPVPQRAETQGRSEEYFGRWLKERKIPRARVVFATKVTGPSGQTTWIRGGPTSLDSRNIKEAIDKRLGDISVLPDTTYLPQEYLCIACICLLMVNLFGHLLFAVVLL